MNQAINNQPCLAEQRDAALRPSKRADKTMRHIRTGKLDDRIDLYAESCIYIVYVI